MRAGFARVHADEDIGRAVFALESSGECEAGRVKSGIVERRSAGDAADTVGTEELFSHENGGRIRMATGRKFSTEEKRDIACKRSMFTDGKRQESEWRLNCGQKV